MQSRSLTTRHTLTHSTSITVTSNWTDTMNFTQEDAAYIKQHLIQQCPAFHNPGTCFCGYMKKKQCPIGALRRLFDVRVDRTNNDLSYDQYKDFVQFTLSICLNTGYCIEPQHVRCGECGFYSGDGSCFRQDIRREFFEAYHAT